MRSDDFHFARSPSAGNSERGRIGAPRQAEPPPAPSIPTAMAEGCGDGRGAGGIRQQQPTGIVGKIWRPDGEILKVVIPADCHIGTVFHPRGAHGSYGWWLDYAAELGVAFVLRGRRKRKGVPGAEKSVLVITGPQGATRPFYQELRHQMLSLLGKATGLPLPQRALLLQIGLDGIHAEEALAQEEAPGSVAEPGPGAPQPDSGDEASEPEDEIALREPLARARAIAQAPSGPELPANQEGLDTSGCVTLGGASFEARQEQLLLSQQALKLLKVLWVFMGSVSASVGTTDGRSWRRFSLQALVSKAFVTRPQSGFWPLILRAGPPHSAPSMPAPDML